ncbi:DUF5813 family protein [Halomicrobium urmianum]|uniref:DUF5813 family protein n=1 Tax=Halomicrobium urmianum TaxID=1586233 RepID=UPI001CD9E43A|nr:DUF5813 family protein [Halomicrobium urmianum]
MSEELADVERTFERADAYARDGDGFRVTTTAFDGRVEIADAPEWRIAYTVTVRAPTLRAATADEVGDAVRDGWFDTLRRRLEDAPKATRASVDLEEFAVVRDGDEVVVTYGFELGSASQAADVAKAFVEYVEGTYVEGVIPGYEYEGAVADLVSDAASGDGHGQAGGTPL